MDDILEFGYKSFPSQITEGLKPASENKVEIVLLLIGIAITIGLTLNYIENARNRQEESESRI